MEKIIIRVEVDGVKLAPIEMGEGHEDTIYKADIKFFRMGHVFDLEHTKALYDYTFSLSRHKTKEELAGLKTVKKTGTSKEENRLLRLAGGGWVQGAPACQGGIGQRLWGMTT